MVLRETAVLYQEIGDEHVALDNYNTHAFGEMAADSMIDVHERNQCYPTSSW